MTKDKLFKSGAVQEDFTFNNRVAEVFDDMLNRSVPYYSTVIDSIAGLLQHQPVKNCTIYDLGCSTGTTLLELARRLPDSGCQFVGIDSAPAMIKKARRKAEMYSRSATVRFREDDITTTGLDDAGAILCNYTLQFIRPMTRLPFVRRLYNALPAGGLCIVSEKVICHDRKLNRDFIDMHHQFKRRQGYSELEIAAKREALENVLVPFSIEENIDLLRQAGFQSVETFFQWFNFASFVALKE
ncbi:MAG TPA: carboxy-S-adenosyl-L-methionine synthase CmoA [Desulfobacteraceae bacterium]|nr:carboxy-S-adenosyl-L-methionine synthase CmoA [Desulfobacteraceae bacterium]